MAVTSEYVFSGQKRKLLHLTNDDGTTEAGVVKIDVSALTFGGGQVPTYVTVDMVDYAVGGTNPVVLSFDATADDELVVLPPGQGTIDFYAYGGKTDPRSAGFTGDVTLTADGSPYDILLHFRPKA